MILAQSIGRPAGREGRFTPQGQQPRGFLLFLIAGSVWGVGTVFSSYNAEAQHAQGIQGVAMLLAVALVTAFQASVLTAWLRDIAGTMIALHAAAAMTSGLINGSESSDILRYVLLLPAMSVMLVAVKAGPRARAGLRAGLTLSGLAYLVYCFGFLDPSSLLDPGYRLTTFMNPNGTGFIVAVTGVSLLDYGLGRLAEGGKRFSVATALLLAGAASCLIVCVATKSRTAMVAFLGASLLRLYLSLGLRQALLTTLALTALVSLTASSGLSSFADQVSHIFQFEDHYRAISEGTGRFATWAWISRDVWLQNFFLGVGPGEHGPLIRANMGVSSAHNGLLANLAETGALGTIPLVVLVVVCTRRLVANRREPRMFFASAVFVAALLESGGEVMFFSIGNPASLLFLLAVAMLCVGPEITVGGPSPTAAHQEDLSGGWPVGPHGSTRWLRRSR